MANPTTASGTVSIYAETNISIHILISATFSKYASLIRDINNAIINQRTTRQTKRHPRRILTIMTTNRTSTVQVTVHLNT